MKMPQSFLIFSVIYSLVMAVGCAVLGFVLLRDKSYAFGSFLLIAAFGFTGNFWIKIRSAKKAPIQPPVPTRGNGT